MASIPRHAGIVFAAGPSTEQGGPAAYVRALDKELSARSYRTESVHFSLFRSFVPGLRHLVFLFRLIGPARRSRAIVAIDTWSVGIPALIAAKLTGCALIIRIGGDFLWEHYIERTNSPVRLSDFYTSTRQLSIKERIIFRGTRFLVSHADAIAFNTEWQKDLWQKPYRLHATRTHVIENRYPPHRVVQSERTNVFVSAGRAARLKNQRAVEEAFAIAQAKHPEYSLDTRVLSETEHEERLRTCHALIQGSVSDIAPNAVIQAASFGTPFICTKDTGIQGRLEQKGLFIDTLSQAELVRAIESLMHAFTYGQLAERTKESGFERDWDAVSNDFETLLRSCGSKPVET